MRTFTVVLRCRSAARFRPEEGQIVTIANVAGVDGAWGANGDQPGEDGGNGLDATAPGGLGSNGANEPVDGQGI